jgi:hypothetical protein
MKVLHFMPPLSPDVAPKLPYVALASGQPHLKAWCGLLTA